MKRRWSIRLAPSLEPFTFADGAVRLAWVTWEVYDNGERAAVAANEPESAPTGWAPVGGSR